MEDCKPVLFLVFADMFRIIKGQCSTFVLPKRSKIEYSSIFISIAYATQAAATTLE